MCQGRGMICRLPMSQSSIGQSHPVLEGWVHSPPRHFKKVPSLGNKFYFCVPIVQPPLPSPFSVSLLFPFLCSSWLHEDWLEVFCVRVRKGLSLHLVLASFHRTDLSRLLLLRTSPKFRFYRNGSCDSSCSVLVLQDRLLRCRSTRRVLIHQKQRRLLP